MFISVFLEYWTMDKVQKPSNPECYTPLSESFRINAICDVDIFGDFHYGFRRKRSTSDQIFLYSSDTGEDMEIQWDSISAIRIHKKVYDSVRREVLYSIIIEFGVQMKLVTLIKMCLNETYNKADWIWVMLATIQFRTFLFLVCCL
jgi:hypothetical protein